RSASRSTHTPADAEGHPPRLVGDGRPLTGPATPDGTDLWADQHGATPAGTPPADGRGCGSAAPPPRQESTRDRHRWTSCHDHTPRERAEQHVRALTAGSAPPRSPAHQLPSEAARPATRPTSHREPDA